MPALVMQLCSRCARGYTKAVKPRVYIETSIVSYLVARPSNDVRIAACQNITAEWGDDQRPKFELYISEFVLAEASRGNEEAASRRLAAIAEIPALEVSEQVKVLVQALIDEGAIPTKAELDAFHIAVAAVNGINICSPGIVPISPTR